MNLFQSLALGMFGVLALLTVSASIRGTLRKRIAVLWLSLWIIGAVTVVWPSSTAVVAHALGIGRGADLLLYLSVLVMIAAFFYAYTRFKRVERQLTLLVRRLAVQNAMQSKPRGAGVAGVAAAAGLSPLEDGSAGSAAGPASRS